MIGAGVSKNSGIPTGWELSEKWYNDLKEDLEKEELEKLMSQNVRSFG